MMFQHLWWWLALLIGIFALVVWYFYSLLARKIEPAERLNREKILRMLGPSERAVIDRLIRFEGTALQSDLSREMDKLRVHRAVKSLQQKGIIEVLPRGRTRLIKLAWEFRGLL